MRFQFLQTTYASSEQVSLRGDYPAKVFNNMRAQIMPLEEAPSNTVISVFHDNQWRMGRKVDPSKIIK